jgi:hypothetical protein
MKVIRHILFLSVLAGTLMHPAEASLTIEQISFHRATHSQAYTENYPVDNGGVMFVFLRNAGAVPAAVSEVRINGTPLQDLQTNGTISWWRIWPAVVPAGGVSTVTAKATGAPLTEGASVTVTVTPAVGQPVSATATLATPRLRIGGVLPSPDWRTVYVFLRNLDTVSHTVTQLFLNEDVTASMTLAGGPVIAPNSVGIAKVTYPAPLSPLTPLAVRVRSTRTGGEIVTVGAPVRLVEPWFPVGSWSSSMATNDAGQELSRQALLDTVTGSNDWQAIRQMADRFFIRTFNIINTGDPKYPDPAVVAAQTGNPDIRAWFLRDEPDLNGVPVLQIKEGNDILWADPTHPSFLNLNTTRAFNTYGHIPDIIGQDHYVMYAPNNIPGTGITRFARMEEAIEFSDQLKLNTEPKIMWNWSQLAGSAWNRQPEPWGVNYQFWANVMTGSRGILWFVLQPNTASSYPAQFQEAVKLGRQLSQIRNLCLYGESIPNLTFSTTRALGRSLVGENAVVVIVLNNNYTVGGFPWSPNYSISPLSGTVTVPVPSWIPVQQVYRVTPEGTDTPTHTVNPDGTVTISFSMHTEMQVFVIGKQDTTPPAAPSRVCIARYSGPDSCRLSWEEPYDDFGVKGYKVYADGQEVADVREPMATISGLANPENVRFTVRAYDSAGNLSQPSPAVRWLTWSFETPGYFKGWDMANHILLPAVPGGALQFDIGGNDPYIISPEIRADASRFRYLRIRMRNASSGTLGQVFFSTESAPGWDESRTVTFSLFPNDVGFTEYFVDMRSSAQWTGTITRIRLDPVANASAGRIVIEEIQLTTSPSPDTTPPSGSVLINGGAPFTNNIAVTLNLTATDDSGVLAAQFSQNGVSWTAWEPFVPARSWNLVSLDGTRSVFARFRDTYGNISPAVSDTIVLDRVPPPTPAQPSGPSPFTGDPQVTFTWNPVTDALSGTAGYICRIGTTPGGSDVFNGSVGNTLIKTITGQSGQTYYCRVQAVDNAGNVSGLSAVSAGVLVDTEPPATPSAPTDAGVYTTSPTVLFQWSAPDDPGGSGVAGYDLQAGTAPGTADVFSGDAGDVLSHSIQGAAGRSYFSRVRARDRAGNVGGWSPWSDGIAVVEKAGLTPAGAKLLPDGGSAGISGAVVSQTSGAQLWVQDEGRAAGLRLQLLAPAAGIAPGSRVEAGGQIRTLPEGERYLEGVAGVTAQGAAPEPLGISNAALGGGAWFHEAQTGAGQAGITGGSGTGNIGLLVRIWGRVTYVDAGGGFFVVSDGSGVTDSSGHAGVRVSGGVPPWLAPGEMVGVRGISSCFREGSQTFRLLIVSGDNAITRL